MNVLAITLSGGMGVILLGSLILASRNRVLLKLALRNIPRRKAQTALIMVGLMLSTTIIMAALAIGDSIDKGIRLGALNSLGATDIRLSSPVASRFGDDYLDEAMVDRVRSELRTDGRVDGILPLIREQMPVINEVSGKTLASAVVVGVNLDSLDGFGHLLVAEEKGSVDISRLQDGETVINQPMSDELDVGIGDQITLVSPLGRSEHKVMDIVAPSGLAGGTQLVRSAALFPVGTIQRVLDREGKYNMIEVSVTGDYIAWSVTHDEIISKEVAEKLKLAFINDAASEALFNILKTPGLSEMLEAELDERGSGPAGPFSSDKLAELVPEIQKDAPSDEFKITVTDSMTLAAVMGMAEETGDPNMAQSLFLPIMELVELNVDPIKNRSLEFAEAISAGIVVFFTIFGSFSIIVGLLLIFLVFIMLAASRTTEMGIARAVGTKRRHLVQMFTYEGLVYSVGASVLGTGLGLLASVLLMQMMIRAFADSDDVTFFYSVTFRSIVIAFSAGFVLTALTVVISAYRVSKLNIVVAIRGLSQEFVSDEIPGTGQRAKTVIKWIFGPFTFAHETWRMWRSGQGVVLRIAAFFGLLLVVPWLAIFLWKVFKFFQPWLTSGWPLIPVGLVVALTGLDPEKGIKGLAFDNAALVTIGTTLVIISTGLAVRSVLAAKGYKEEFQKRVSMTFIGVTMLVFFSLPFDALEGITGELEGGPEMFILSGVSMVAASVWVVMHNADVLVWVVSKFIGRWGSLRPVVKMAIAYPMSARLRTGLTLAMFSLVIFTMMIFAILINLGNVIADDPDRVSGGFDIRGTIKPELPIGDPYEVIDTSGDKLAVSDFEMITAQARIRVEAHQDDAEEPLYKGARVRASDEVWLANNRFELTHWDPEYGSTSREIWQAVASDPTLAVVAGGIISPEDGFGPPRGGSSFQIEGIKPDERGEITGVDITLRPPIGQGAAGRSVNRKIIGVLDQFADSLESNGFGAAPNDIYMHFSVLEQLSDKPVPFIEYKFRIADPSRTDEITRLLETVFIEHGMQAEGIEQVINRNQAQSNAFNQLFQGFMGLGLLVGVAALGVVAFRAVIERRQSIGMLRALGYKARMIQLQFLAESGVVAVLGSALGIGLGTLIAWNIFKSISQESEGITFSVPIVDVMVIVLVAVVFSLLNTLLPARQGSSIKPSEALRYE